MPSVPPVETFIYRYTFESTAPSVAQTVRVVREVRFEKIGQTQVQPPEWARRGREQRNDTQSE